MRACVKALIEEYGKDIFEREMEANEKEFLSTVINSRVRIMHIKRNQKIKYFDGNESVLESGRIDHSESDRNSQFELNRNSQCTLAN